MSRKLNDEELLLLKQLVLEGKYDTEIGSILNCDRKIIGKYRKSLNLPSYKDVTENTIDKLKKYSEEGLSLSKISKLMRMSDTKIRKLCKQYNIKIKFQFVIDDKIEQEILKLYEEGKMDTEIAKILNIKAGTVANYRTTHNLPTKFTYDKISKIDNAKFEELFNQGLSDYKIAKLLNMSSDGVYSHRMRHGYFRDSLSENKPIELSDFQKQVLLGTMLGDSSFKRGIGQLNPIISCTHCVAQKEYCEYKTDIFKNLNAKCKYQIRKTPDKRNGNIYESYTMYVPANPAIKDWDEAFYKNNKKVIPFELFNYFTEVSLAFMFMDDGTKTQNSYSIATNCFTTEELTQFRIFLLEKFNLETSLFKGNILYIRSKSRDLFTSLISPYVCECMKYKLHSPR